MKAAVESRELITLGDPGSPVRGTYHKPRKASGAVADATGATGILFFNALSIPRTGTGDTMVHWADAFADIGYPCFRIDLPGLGDSGGDVVPELLHFINAGGYASVAATAGTEIVERFNLSGVVIWGLCAGAVSAMFAAAACRECKGLVLMDPYFHVAQATRPKWRLDLSEWALRSGLGGFTSNLYDRLKDIRLLLHGSAPPENANAALLNSWKKIAAEERMPIMIFKAPARKTPGTKPRLGEFDYVKYVLDLAGPKSQVTVKVIDVTDHSFANVVGRTAVLRNTGRWLDAYFPLPEEVYLGEVHSVVKDKQSMIGIGD